jgi:hypothetical protein
VVGELVVAVKSRSLLPIPPLLLVGTSKLGVLIHVTVVS